MLVASQNASKPFPIVASDQASVIAYTDPKLPASSFDRAWRAAGKVIRASGLPFEVSSSLVSRTITLTATGRSLTRGDVLAGAGALDGMPHVLGVEVPSIRHAPFCGVATSPAQDRSTQQVANALIGLHLGLQDLEYYYRTIPGRTDVNSIVFLLRVDRDFARQLSGIDLKGVAAIDRQRFLEDRAKYDSTLERVGRAINAQDDDEFDATVKQSRRDRFASSDDLDRLRQDLGLPELTCYFTII